MIHNTSSIARSADHVACDFDGEVLLLSIQNGKYYHLNETASLIWEAIESPAVVDGICSRLRRRYAVDAAECEREVVRMLEEMRAAGLVTVL